MAEADEGPPRPELERAREAIAVTLVRAGRPLPTTALVAAITDAPLLHSFRHGPLDVTVGQVLASLEAMRADGTIVASPPGATQDEVRWSLAHPGLEHGAQPSGKRAVTGGLDTVDAAGDALFAVRVLYGPPRPVVLISVLGDLDRSNESRFFEHVHRADHVAGEPRYRFLFGARRVTSAVVVDLRGASYVSAGVFGGLLTETARRRPHLRLVLREGGAPQRALRALGLQGELDVHHELGDAVLAGLPLPE